MAIGNAAEILVCNGDGVVKRIEENGIRCLRAGARKCEKARAEDGSWSGRENVQRAGKFFVEHGDECFECGGFAGGKAGWANEGLQIRSWECAQSVEGECAGIAKVGERALHGFPSCVLREIGAQNDFKRGFRPATSAAGRRL